MATWVYADKVAPVVTDEAVGDLVPWPTAHGPRFLFMLPKLSLTAFSLDSWVRMGDKKGGGTVAVAVSYYARAGVTFTKTQGRRKPPCIDA